MREALTWYVVVQVGALAVWPLVARALAPLDDRGWAVSKIAGLLSIAWIGWLICMLSPVPFSRLTLAVVLVLLGVIAWTYQLRLAGLDEIVGWLRKRRRLVLT